MPERRVVKRVQVDPDPPRRIVRKRVTYALPERLPVDPSPTAVLTGALVYVVDLHPGEEPVHVKIGRTTNLAQTLDGYRRATPGVGVVGTLPARQATLLLDTLERRVQDEAARVSRRVKRTVGRKRDSEAFVFTTRAGLDEFVTEVRKKFLDL